MTDTATLPQATPCGSGTDVRDEPAPSLPAWVAAFTVGSPATNAVVIEDRRAEVTSRPPGDACAVSVRLVDAASLPTPGFRAAVKQVYDTLRQGFEAAGCPFPVRVWNFIPGIHRPMGGGLDRYRVFNQGRFDSLSEWSGGPEHFPRLLPTATGVGHAGRDLWIHALCSSKPGTPVENPRQHPAFRYSARYGPRPPCFARATAVSFRERPMLLIGGTASVRGEESVYADSLDKQLGEMYENLATLMAAAARSIGVRQPAPLDALSAVRAYYVRPADRERIESSLMNRLPDGAQLELVRADICRPELLVEVEGLAYLSS